VTFLTTTHDLGQLCDDSFEEHVLAYPPELTGLHLHGLNKNTAAFSTYSPSEVDAFAEEFGFIKTAHLDFATASDVRRFTDNLAETGSWNGEAVEGFVIRCKIADRSTDADAEDLTSAPTPSENQRQHGDSWKNSAIIMHPPYPSSSDYFFNVKFFEPYLMYRAWREITKTILSAKANGLNPISIPKSRLARVENKLYREWVEHEIDARPGDFAEYPKGKGIIETRERFLRWFNTKEGQKRFIDLGGATYAGEGAAAQVDAAVVNAAEDERREQPKAERDIQTGKLVIVPIAVPGCGKPFPYQAGLDTSRLAHLFIRKDLCRHRPHTPVPQFWTHAE
jgi:tRNA ligase